MRLFFIRHAQSANNALVAETGSIEDRREDPEITELGRRQAGKLAQFLKSGNPLGGSFREDQAGPGFDISHLYTSLMVRSVATGSIIAQQLDLPLVAWEDIHERGGIYLEDQNDGDFIGRPGKDREYFEAQFPELVLPPDLEDTGWWNYRPFEGPEHWPRRARRFLSELRARHGGTHDRVAVISHGGFYNDFLRVLIGLSQDQELWFEMLNAAVTRIDFTDEGTRIIFHNRVDYLPPKMIS